MHDSLDQQQTSSTARPKKLPRELAIAGLVLALVMIATGVALWLVAASLGEVQGQSQATSPVQTTPTHDLLQELGDDLGPTSTKAELEAAVHDWIARQDGTTPRQLAILALGS